MSENWRDGLNSFPTYKKKFALLPTVLVGGEKVWLKTYYKKFTTYHTSYGGTIKMFDEEYSHTDFVENISEETYVIRKLSENL
jgi:hypothetical protein